MRRLVYFILSGVVFFLATSRAGAQDLSRHNWYFGDGTQAIRFDRTTNDAELISKTLPVPAYGVGGGTVATDHTNRNLLFYSDGDNVFDVQGLLMPTGGGLGGATAGNQTAVSCPVPGQPNQFYIFRRDAAGEIRHSIVDMTQFGNSPFPAPATGDVIAASRNQPVGTGLLARSEAMLIIPQPLDTAYWLISHQFNTTNYTVTSINSNGVFTNSTFGGLGFDLTAASFAYHEGAAVNRIAVAPTDADMNILILGFDNVNGVITGGQFLFNTSAAATTEPATYDLEFSPSGQYLYVSRTGDTGIEAHLLQYDFTNPTNTMDTIATPALFRSWGLQLAPDSSIYHVYQETAGGAFKIGRLIDPDSLALSTTYRPAVFGNGNFNAKQFPSFAPKPNVLLTVNFVERGLCTNSETAFFPTVTPAADSLVWDLGDGSATTTWSPVHTYTASGNMQVRVVAFLKGDTASFTKSIQVNQFDLTLTLAQDTTACKCELPINNSQPECGGITSDDFSIEVKVQGGTATSFQWYGPGGVLATQTTATLRPDSAGYYYVVVSDGTTCTAHAGVNIKEYGVEEQLANIWYFGTQAGIDFNDGTVPISNPVMDAPEGCAIVCDQNGQAVFFTDGNTVWNRDFDVLETGIGGDLNATQSVFIMPVSDDETLYYIFTTQEIYGTGVFELRYSLFDLTADNSLGGNGDVVQKAIPLFSRSTERITGNQNWLIAHEYGNNSFRAYQVSALGISLPVISSVGSDHLFTIQQQGEGYMKLGAMNRLAVALATPGVSNVVEVFDFIDSTGVVGNFRTADLNTAAGQVYGVEFSPGGNKLFATLTGAPSRLVEFSIDSLGNPYLKNMFPISANSLGAIQTGPDGQIYVAVDGQTSLGTISPVEDTTLVSSFNLTGFSLLGSTTSQLGLPNFAQNVSTPSQQPSITVTGLCFGSPSFFSGTGTDNIDDLEWAFGDGASFVGDTATHTYAAPGDYIVNLRITNRCGLDTVITRTITIEAPPANPTFLPPGVTPVLCTGSLQLEATPATNPDLADLTFLWTNGQTTRTITVSSQQILGVTITHTNGCSSDGTILISDNRPQVELGPDLTICENTPIAPLDAQNPGATYTWTINNGSTTNTQTRSVDTTVPGIFEYKVEVLDPITTCEVADSITFTVNALPVFTVTPVNTTGCGLADGTIQIEIPATGGSYSYSITGPPAVQLVNQTGPIDQTYAGYIAGSYGVTVQDDLSGCPASTVVTISDNVFTVDATQVGTCDPVAISIDPSAVGIYNYRVIDNTNTVIIPSSPVTSDPFTTPTVASNVFYTIELTRNDGCIASDTLTVQQTQQVAITGFTSSCDLATGETLVTVSSPDAPTSYDWSVSQAGSISGSTSGATITLNPGTWNLSVTVGNATLCPATSTFTASGVAPFTASLAPTDPCIDPVFINAIASPAGSYTYLWTENGTSILGGQSIQLTVANDDFVYGVTVRSTISGCSSVAPDVQVNVVGNFSATLTTTPPCEGTPFTLTTTATQIPDSYVWTFNGGVIAGAVAPSHQDTRDGLYTVTVDRDVCSDTETITIINAPTTPGSMPSEGIICDLEAGAQEVLLTPGDNFIAYQWYKDGVMLTDANAQASEYPATESGIYRVDLINTYNCPSSDQITLVRECDPKIVAPTAFRPGSSTEINRAFFVYTYFIEDTDFQVFIFNRWGEIVFESKDPNFTWNGTRNNGVLLPAGTYTYVVKYKSAFRDEPGETRGGVVLVR